jgi:adenylate cyclase
MVEINRGHAARGLPRLEMGIGINTGEAVVGNIGSEQRAKYAVVGSAVNAAARVESSTVGGQVFISAATYDRIRDLAEVAEPVTVEVKGIAEPLVLYELHAVRGRFAQRRPEATEDAGPQIEVALPLTCWVIDGKVVGKDARHGLAVRLGPRQIDARLDTPLALLTNVRLRLSYPAIAHESGDLYGKVVGFGGGNGGALFRIRLTWVDSADQKVIEGFF